MQELFSQLFKKDIDDASAKSMLMDTSKEYPWFTAAHFFLLKKMNDTEEGYEKTAARTALLFNNPFMLNYRLKEEKKTGSILEVPPVNIVDKLEVVETKAEPVMETKIAAEKIIEAVEVKPEEVPKANTENKKEEMLFEPLFATDYFASQGIKLSEEVQTGDKLGKQLKSFTEWLKSMKKVHESKPLEGNEQVDLAVQNLAEKSNQEADVLTESMAEAYLQQGKLKKARETFEKLSLLNPAKSAYFAAKIESITHN